MRVTEAFKLGTPKGKLDIKRLRLPGVSISFRCPKCGEMRFADLGREYLSYPKVNEPTEFHSYCGPCDEASTVNIQLNVNLEVIP